MSTLPTATPSGGERSLFGHPKGLFFLAFTEAWERFSYYGMSALVVLYMVNQLFLPGHAEHIVGFGPVRAALESVSGPMSPQALASQIFGLYSGFIYFTPLVGGIIADRWTGQRNAVVLGALAMAGGHLAMAFDQSFLFAMLLLVIGSGLLKGNISAQVGTLYPRDDEARRTRGFVIFSTGINIGAVIGPLLCGLLAQLYGWHFGFGVAAVCMLLGLATYLAGFRYLPARVPRSSATGFALKKSDWRVIGALVVVICITILPSLAYGQHFNALPVWIQDHVALNVGSFRIPIPWYQSIDALVSVLMAPALLWLWRRQSARGVESGDLGKIAVGSWITAASNLVLVCAIFLSGGRPINPLWPALYCIGLGIAFVYYWPVLLALVSRAAPTRVNATMMGIVFMSLFIGYTLMGWLGSLYERMTPSEFWIMHAAIGASGGLSVLLFGRKLSAVLHTS